MKTKKMGELVRGLLEYASCAYSSLVFDDDWQCAMIKIHIFFPYTGWLILRLINPFFHRIHMSFQLIRYHHCYAYHVALPGTPQMQKDLSLRTGVQSAYCIM